MRPSNIAFSNLRAEMARSNITVKEMANVIGVTRDTMSNKLSRKSPLNLDEAFVIKHTFFPNKDILYLFKEIISDALSKTA